MKKTTQEVLKNTILKLEENRKSTLIISFYYSNQLNNAKFISSEKSLNINTITMSKYSDYQSFTNSLDQLLKLIKGHKLIIIGGVPGASKYNDVNCLYRLRWFSLNSNQCLPKQKESLIHVNKILKEYASKHQNVYFINPYSTFCKNGYCKNLDSKGIPLYSDGSHLSKTGSNYFMKNIRTKIMDIISSK